MGTAVQHAERCKQELAANAPLRVWWEKRPDPHRTTTYLQKFRHQGAHLQGAHLHGPLQERPAAAAELAA
jgi:hypothetical protein